MKGSSGPARAALLRAVPVLAVVAALAAPAVAIAQAPATGSPAVDRALKRIPPNDLERDHEEGARGRPVPSSLVPKPADTPLAAANPGFSGRRAQHRRRGHARRNAWFVVEPSFPDGGELSATITNQGYVAVKHASVLYPSIAFNAAGQGVMTFTVSGKDLFPSAAYAPFAAGGGNGPVHVAGPGAEPIDGFVGYLIDIGVSRWGDYSAAVPAADGSLWIATEYTPGGRRDPIENWGTFVGHLVP